MRIGLKWSRNTYWRSKRKNHLSEYSLIATTSYLLGTHSPNGFGGGARGVGVKRAGMFDVQRLSSTVFESLQRRVRQFLKALDFRKRAIIWNPIKLAIRKMITDNVHTMTLIFAKR